MPASFSSRAEAALRRRGGRMTRSRRALLDLIESDPRPLGPRELHRELRRRGTPMDLVSVYRNVAALLELGLLHRVLGSTAVRPCAGREPRCHHAVVCTGCGSAREFHSRPLERALAGVRRATGFSIQEHLLELRGLCAACMGHA
ncbi:MAG TPA: Fur family transcriptional regulator [Myxococcales bacterium]